MRLHRLELTAFGPYAGTECVDFNALAAHGIFLLTGPTGAGKTSVLDAICYALYGAVPGARQTAKRLRSDHASPITRTTVTLEVSIRGHRLRVRRTPEQTRPKQRGTGTTLAKATATLEEWVDGAWQCLSTRPDEVGDQLGQLLGMSREQFCQVVLLPQGEFASFLRADAEQRRVLLQRLFATERFEQVEKQLRMWRAEADVALAGREAELHEALARLAEASGGGEVPAGTDALAWADDVRDLVRKQHDATVEEATAARVAARRARDRHRAAEELAAMQRQHAEALHRREALDAARPDMVLREHELAAARRANAVVPMLESAVAAAAATASATASVATARAALAALAPAGPELAGATAATLATTLAATQVEIGALTTTMQLERDASARAAEADLHDATAEDAAERLRLHDEWLADYDAEHERRVQQLMLVREHAALADQRREAVRAAADRLAAAERRDALAKERDRRRDVVSVLVDRAQDARERLFDLREQRINAMASELAEDLLPGQPCPVCGSPDHPAPAPTGPAGVTTADEVTAYDEWNAAEQERRVDETALQQVEAALAAARAAAGGDDPVAARKQALADARDALAAAEEAAASCPEFATGLAAFETERAERDRERARWLQRRQAAVTAAAEARRFVAATIDRIQQARGEDASVASRVERLRLLADALDSVVQAERDAAEGARQARRAQHAATAAARTAGFRDLDDAADAARRPQRVDELQAELAAYRVEEAKVAEHLGNPVLVTAAAAPPVDVASALVELEEIESQLRVLDGRLGAAKTAVAAVDRLHAQIADGLATLRPLAERSAVLGGLCDLVNGTGAGNDKRMTLSAYVLAARLEQVAAAASERLLRMSGGRYCLAHTDERDSHGRRSGLGLAVVDGWTGQRRPTSTLSGGESFFASLALALGLADVASAEAGGTRLATLFVDEGFGSLDDDTLDEVMSVLDGLRDAGRVIGIVSHVADLQQRIPAQLAVTKTTVGSTLGPSGPGNA